MHDAFEGLGPLTVTQDLTKERRFFGMAQLPLRIEAERAGDASDSKPGEAP